MTILLTTHYLDEAQRLCDRVAIMNRGEIAALDAPGALLAGLGGEILEMRLDGDAAAALAIAARPRHRDGRRLHRRLDHDAPAAPPQPPPRPSPRSTPPTCARRAITTRAPTLDDVYLRLTGNPHGRGGLNRNHRKDPLPCSTSAALVPLARAARRAHRPQPAPDRDPAAHADPLRRRHRPGAHDGAGRPAHQARLHRLRLDRRRSACSCPSRRSSPASACIIDRVSGAQRELLAAPDPARAARARQPRGRARAQRAAGRRPRRASRALRGADFHVSATGIAWFVGAAALLRGPHVRRRRDDGQPHPQPGGVHRRDAGGGHPAVVLRRSAVPHQRAARRSDRASPRSCP